MNKLTVFYDHIRNAALQENISIEEVASKIKAAGISGVEIEYCEITDELVSMLKKLDLPISSVYHTFNWEVPCPDSYLSTTQDGINEFDEMLSKLNSWDIHFLLAIPGFISDPTTHLEGMEAFAPRLNALCDAADNYDIQILMEDFDGIGAPFGTGSELKWFMDKCPKLGCAFDTGNFMFHAEDSYEVLPMLIDRIKYVHCKDRALTPMHPECGTEDALKTIDNKLLYSVSVGSGVIKMTEILSDILATGYSGPLAIEHFGSLAMFDDILSSAKYLRDQF